MVDSTSFLEKEFKKLAIKIHLEYFGKGPEDVWVKINKNVATFYCSKTITPLEETLLRISNGKEEVIRIRQKIYQHIKSHLFLELERVSGYKVLSLTGDICIDTKALYGSVLFLQNIEENQ